jgi:uncharacterized protein YukE
MSRAVVDPAELRRFASGLKNFTGDVRQYLAVLQAQFNSLGDTWRDQEHEKFAQEFEQTVRVLTHFIATAADHVPFLLRKAERIEEYLHQR